MSIINQPPSSNLWTEPESAANTANPPVYPYNNITQTESGHTFEMDDTKGRERVRLQHRSGSFIEMHPNGDEVHKVYGDGYEITIKNKNVRIKGVCNITVDGDCNMHVGGDLNQVVDGNYNLQVGKEITVRSHNDMKIYSDDNISLYAGGDYTGSINLNAPDCVYINSDVVVGGSVNADYISSTTRVDAVTGVSAGLLGVYSKGPITSLMSCSAPIGTFSFMNAILMTDTINTNIYKFHIHPAPKGMTGTPILPMV
jgi:hypothetical protein